MQGPLLIAAALLAASPASQDGSLEAYLRRLRVQREALHAQLREPVRELVDQLEGLDDPSRSELERLRQALDDLGPEAGPILVLYIDPGDEGKDGATAATKGRVLRAREVTNALVRLRAPGIVEDLIRRTSTGSTTGRVHAVEILGTSPEPERAGAWLEELFRTSEGELRLEAVRALARLGGTEGPTLRAALTDSDTEVVATVLAALAEARSADAAPAVLNLTKLPDAAAPVSAGIVAYYDACPEVVSEEVVEALVGLALSNDVELEDRILVLDALPGFEEAKGAKLRRQLEPILDTSVTALREAGLICLATLGDRSAKRDLLETYDDLVQNNDDWPDAYERRADVQLKIGDYNEAVRDYKRAIELLSSRARQGAYKKLWISMARAYVKGQKLRQAHDTLEDIGLTDAQKAELAADPDFAPLREHSRYRKILE